jgi:hypothetical protein
MLALTAVAAEKESIGNRKNLPIPTSAFPVPLQNFSRFQTIIGSAFAVRDLFPHDKRRGLALFLHLEDLVDFVKMLGNMPPVAPRCSGPALFICL